MTRPSTSPSEAIPTTVLLYHAGIAGENKTYLFTDGSITYYERIIKNSFEYMLIDNLGTGSIRVTYNRPDLDISNYINGAKTLKSGDSLYIEEIVSSLKIYFLQNSTVEVVLKSGKEGT